MTSDTCQQQPSRGMSRVLQEASVDAAPRVVKSPSPSLCRRLQLSLVVLVVTSHLLVLGHDLCTATCNKEGSVTTTIEPRKDNVHCFNETCFAKCCADHQGVAASETFSCVGNETDFDSVEFLSKVVFELQMMEHPEQYNNSSNYFMFHYNCVGLTNCVDFVIGTDMIFIRDCNMNDDPPPKTLFDTVVDVLLVSCMVVSSISISLVLAVFLYLSQLQGPHGNILLCYLLLVMALHPTLIWSHYSPTNTVCFNSLVFLGLSSVSWLTVMSYDIWSTFSRPLRPRSNSPSANSKKRKFIVYSLVGWGFPITHLLLFLYVKCETNTVIYKSISFVMALNLVMFVSTVVNIRMIHSAQTDMWNSHRHNHTQQGLLLYVKLSLFMGVDWVIFLSCWMFANYLVLIMSYALLESQGTLLFVLLVCNRRVLRLLRDKWRGQQPNAIRL